MQWAAIVACDVNAQKYASYSWPPRYQDTPGNHEVHG